MKRIVRYTAIVFATLAVLVLMWEFRFVIALVLASLFLAAAVRPLNNRLGNLGIPLLLAQFLLYVAAVGILVLLLFLIGDDLLKEAEIFTNWFAVFYENSYHNWEMGASWQQSLATRLPPPNEMITAVMGGSGQIVGSLLGVTRGFFGGLAGLLLIIVFSLYWGVDQNRFERLWLSLLPAEQRMQARNSWRQIETAVGGYLRSELVQSGLTAVFLSVAFYLLRLDYPLLLGLIGGIVRLVPLAGPLFLVAITFGVGWLRGPQWAMTAAVYTTAVLTLLELVVEPYLFPRHRYSSLLLLLLVLLLGDVMGLAGVVLAPPLTAVIQDTVRELASRQRGGPTAVVPLSDLETQLARVRQELQETAASDPTPEIENLVRRLEALMQRAHDLPNNNETAAASS